MRRLRQVLAALFVAAACGAPASALTKARLVKDLTGGQPVPFPTYIRARQLTRIGDRIFFVVGGFTDDRDESEIWVTDGSDAGTRQLTHLNPQAPRVPIGGLAAIGERLFFGFGSALWVMDANAGTVMGLTPQSTYPHATISGLAVADDLLYFRLVAESSRLCRSDGTPAGTRCIYGGVSEMGPTIGRRLFFVADDFLNQEPWVAVDGESVQRLRDIAPGDFVSSHPSALTVFDGALFFFADDGGLGYDLWRSDGTPFGTRPVADIDVRIVPTFFATPATIALRRQLYFFASDATHSGRLWRTDGSEAGTGPVAAGPRDAGGLLPFARAGGRLLGIAGDGDDRVALWAFDPASGRGERLARVDGYPWLDAILEVDGQVVFTSCGTRGCEPWISDGSARGTRQLADVAPGVASSAPYQYTRLGAEIIFTATDGRHPEALWALPVPGDDPCAGDCSGDGEVSIDELIVGIGIAISDRPSGDCASLDRNGDGRVAIEELVGAVGRAAAGCWQ